MAFRIRTGEIIIEVDTAQEVQIVLQAMKLSKPSAFEHLDLAQFYCRLGESNQARLLKALRQRPDGMTDTELRLELGLRNNNVLAGITGGLSKTATKAGLTFAEIVIRTECKGKGKRRSYHYQLTEPMLSVVPESF